MPTGVAYHGRVVVESDNGRLAPHRSGEGNRYQFLRPEQGLSTHPVFEGNVDQVSAGGIWQVHGQENQSADSNKESEEVDMSSQIERLPAIPYEHVASTRSSSTRGRRCQSTGNVTSDGGEEQEPEDGQQDRIRFQWLAGQGVRSISSQGSSSAYTQTSPHPFGSEYLRNLTHQPVPTLDRLRWPRPPWSPNDLNDGQEREENIARVNGLHLSFAASALGPHVEYVYDSEDEDDGEDEDEDGDGDGGEN
ncbi:MAG: hypothetical protein M1820_000423 [Bogoriella megaspora]|nr:MAG: hypothetical protein M1820_000423 [Bogoriella megaspora]